MTKNTDSDQSIFYIACVLYNQAISNIASLDAFTSFKAKHNDVWLIISDNSDNNEIKQDSQKELKKLDAVYLDNNGNIGLSKAYNRILEFIGDGPFWLMLSDDDTIFSLDFLENAYNTSKQTEANAISGIVMAGGHIMSPLRNNKVFSNNDNCISSPGQYDNIFCINSGLIIRDRVFAEIGLYDESLFLDMIDYWFMDKLIENNLNRIEIVSGSIIQNFSANEEKPKKAVMKRFGIYRKDFSTYCRLTDKSGKYKWGIISKRFLSITVSDIKNRLKRA